MSKFTKAPWFVAETRSRHIHMVRGNGGDAAICETARWLDTDPVSESRANAHLISAAPDMYEALELAAYSIQNCSRASLFQKAVLKDDILPALAKARGEQ